MNHSLEAARELYLEKTIIDKYLQLAKLMGLDPTQALNEVGYPTAEFNAELENQIYRPQVEEILQEINDLQYPSDDQAEKGLFARIYELYTEIAVYLQYRGEIFYDYICLHPDLQKEISENMDDEEVASRITEIQSLENSDRGKIEMRLASVYGQIGYILSYKGIPYNQNLDIDPALLQELRYYEQSPAIIDLLDEIDTLEYIDMVHNLTPKQLTELFQDINALFEFDSPEVPLSLQELAAALQELALAMGYSEQPDLFVIGDEIKTKVLHREFSNQEAKALFDLFVVIRKFTPVVELVRQRNEASRRIAKLDNQIAYLILPPNKNAVEDVFQNTFVATHSDVLRQGLKRILGRLSYSLSLVDSPTFTECYTEFSDLREEGLLSDLQIKNFRELERFVAQNMDEIDSIYDANPDIQLQEYEA